MTRKKPTRAQEIKQLTETQQAFIEAYLGDAYYCASKAARMIGSRSDSAAWQRGYRMMKNPAVRAAIDAIMDQQYPQVAWLSSDMSRKPNKP